MKEGKFYRGAWKDDDPAIVHTFSIKPDSNRPGMPTNPELYLDGIRLKGVTGVTVEINGGELNMVSIDFAAQVDLEIPIVDINEEMGKNGQ